MLLPQNDVDDVLGDPDFQTSFDVVRSVQVMVGGRAVDTATTTSGVLGVVEPDRGRTLQRMQNGEKQVDSIRIWTVFRLTAGASGANLDADKVVWNGATYTVVAIRDWSQYGQGYVEATADMLDYVHP